MDNPVFRTIGKMVDLVWINILTLICALPVFTAGASFSAMYYLLLRMAEDKKGPLTGDFFRAFRENFKNATKVWLVALALLIVYAYNLYLIDAGALDGLGLFKKITLAVIVLILFALITMLVYTFALFARYDNGVKATLKNAAMLAIAFFPRSLCMTVLLFFPLALMMLSNYFFWLWILYGFAFPGYLIAMLMVRVFRKAGGEQEEEKDELEDI